eukprot:66599_1
MGTCDSCSRGDDASDAQALIRNTTETSEAGQTQPLTTIPIDPEQAKKATIKEFHKAVAIGNKSFIMYQAEDNPDDDLFNSIYNHQPPLHIALKNQQYEMMKYLLDQDASVDSRNTKTSDTALITAVRLADLHAIKILCSYNADKWIENDDEKTALHIACESGTKEHKEIALYLEPNEDKVQSLEVEITQDRLMTAGTSRVRDFADDVLLETNIDTNTLGVSNMEWNARMDTARLNDVVGDIFDDIQDDLTTRSLKIKTQMSWLERKQHHPPYSWLKRWVIVKDKYLLWSERQMNIDGEVDKKERMRWSKFINLKDIDVIEAVEKDKKKRKFIVKVGDTDYLFRAKDEAERDEWLVQLKENTEWVKTSGLFSDTGDTYRQRNEDDNE